MCIFGQTSQANVLITQKALPCADVWIPMLLCDNNDVNRGRLRFRSILERLIFILAKFEYTCNVMFKYLGHKHQQTKDKRSGVRIVGDPRIILYLIIWPKQQKKYSKLYNIKGEKTFKQEGFCIWHVDNRILSVLWTIIQNSTKSCFISMYCNI